MRTISFNVFLFLLVSCALLSFSQQTSDLLRSSAIASFSPMWHWARSFKAYLQDRPVFASTSRPSEELARLQLEVESLRFQLKMQSEWKEWTEHLISQGEKWGQWQPQAHQPFAQRRLAEMNALFQRQFFAIPAPVIYRDPSLWSSSLWIQVGQRDNEALGRVIVGKNSPVVIGNALIGVVEYVDSHQSRVRLITDSELSISVRAARGKLQDKDLQRFAQVLAERVKPRQDLPLDAPQKATLLDLLHRLHTFSGSEDGYHAKGYLQGSSSPFWRSRGLTLKGVGFNYDYADAEGPARELRTGRPVGASGAPLPLLKEGDLLVTSGLDGVFPAGLQVGVVTEVCSLPEGAYAYELTARPVAPSFHDLQVVFVLPPL